MANRSYLYLKNDQSTRFLCEGIYQIPLFWQCFWSVKDMEEPFAVWQAHLDSVDDIPEEYSQSDQLDIVIEWGQARRYAEKNRSFVATCLPDHLSLYDQLVAYIESNSQAGDVLGANVLEIVEMGLLDEATDELLGNQQALAKNDLTLLGVNSLLNNDAFADLTGYTDDYLENLVAENQLATSSVEPSDEPSHCQTVQSAPVQNNRKKWLLFGLLLAILLRLIDFLLK